MSGRRSDEAAKMANQLGFEYVYSLQGGMNAWDGPVQPFMNNHSPWVHTIFEPETETAQYVVTDLGKEKEKINSTADFIDSLFFTIRNKGSSHH